MQLIYAMHAWLVLQEPNLSCSEMFDVYRKPFAL
jgi:hypothetical protein